ncbi:MAG TPA: outer membrane protein transport protein [Gemmatales bacterium]|nr:outer membrane protein transport protein [Gemmatales bacterium]
MIGRAVLPKAAIFAVLLFPSLAMAQPGIYLPGAGATNNGMAGVSTATPLGERRGMDWEPGALGRVGRNEVSIGGAFVYPELYVSSSMPRLDGTIAAGRTRSDNGFPLIPNIALVTKLDDESPFTFGFGMMGIAGAGVNFPGDATNPILSPTGPFGQFVIGPIFANMQVLQLNPTVAYQMTDRLVVGVGPTVDITLVSFNPAFFAPPNSIGGQPNTFPFATNARPYWGAGFRAGLVYSLTDDLDLGFGYTSKQWLEKWEFNSRDHLGNAQRLSLQASLPPIYSLGLAWRGIECLTLGVDVRYFDYKNTDLFGTPTSDGGLGWDSTVAIALGGNYQLTERLAVRAGYQYNTNPLESTRALINIQSPAVIQHTVTLGTTWELTEALSMSLGYAYAFQNSITGTASQIPAAQIGLEASGHSLLFNVQVKFGNPWRPCLACAATYDDMRPSSTASGSE